MIFPLHVYELEALAPIEARKYVRLCNRIRNSLRQAHSRSFLVHTAKRRSKVSDQYRCDKCALLVDKIYIDHKDPVVDPKTGFINWDDYINRLFCSADGLQCLCFACHKEKTANENLERKRHKTGLYDPNRRAVLSAIRKGLSTEKQKQNGIKALKSHKCQKNLKRQKYLSRTPVVAFPMDGSGATKYFKSVMEASKTLGVDLTCIYRSAAGRRKTAGGYTFRYVKKIKRHK